jgi:hypothetical protein
MTRALPLGLSVLLAGVSIAAIANAAPTFDPSHKRIVIHSSIAGVKLGQSPKAAKRAWHGAGRCGGHGDATTCNWGTERKGHLGFIYATGTDRVFQVNILAGISALHKSVYRKPLTTLKTSKGIGLGSKRSSVKRAYPGGRSINGPGVDYCIRRGNTTTTFNFDERLRVAGITMYRGYGDQLATCD